MNTSQKQIADVVNLMEGEATRLTNLVESGQITVQDYKRLMWERLGISPWSIVEGISFIVKEPEH